MRRFPLVSVLALACASLAACATTGAEPAPAPPPTAAAQIPSQLPRNVRPLHYSISAAPDAANLRFSGQAIITIEVLEATDRIILNAAELEFGDVSLAPDHGSAPPPLALVLPRSDVEVDAEAQTATFRLQNPIPPGRFRLSISYSGRINTQAAGLFALDYQ